MTRFTCLAVLFALVAVTSNAFAPAMPQRMAPATRLSLMQKEDVDKLLTQAKDCAEGECSVDDVSELIDVLQDQQKELFSKVEEVKDMIKALEAVNGATDRPVDEVRETVRAIYRIFQLGDKASGNDYPALSKPTGWPGEVGKGAKTAYDVLPPKKWKKSTP